MMEWFWRMLGMSSNLIIYVIFSKAFSCIVLATLTKNDVEFLGNNVSKALLIEDIILIFQFPLITQKLGCNSNKYLALPQHLLY